MSPKDAIALVKKKRTDAHPNPWQKHAIAAFAQKIARKKKT